MKRIILLLMGSALLLAGCAAADGQKAETKPPARQMLMVADEPCGKTVDHVRKVLFSSLSLGMDHEAEGAGAHEFVTTLQREAKDRQYQAVVKVECRRKEASRIWVLVLAERRGADGIWRPDPETEEIEQRILKALAR